MEKQIIKKITIIILIIGHALILNAATQEIENIGYSLTRLNEYIISSEKKIDDTNPKANNKIKQKAQKAMQSILDALKSSALDQADKDKLQMSVEQPNQEDTIKAQMENQTIQNQGGEEAVLEDIVKLKKQIKKELRMQEPKAKKRQATKEFFQARKKKKELERFANTR